MKHSFLYTALVLTTAAIAMGSTTFGDSKVRTGSGGFNRGQGGNHGGQTSRSFSGRIGNLSGGEGNGHGKSGNGGAGNGHLGGINISGGFNQQQRGTKLPHFGNSGNDQHEKQLAPINLPSRIGDSGKSKIKGILSPNLQHPIRHPGHSILLPNGTKTKSIAIDVAQIRKHKGPSSHVQPQIQNIVATAPKHLCVNPHFSWWVNTCHDHCQTHYGCWNIHNQYWDCWTPCNWQVVRCEQFTFYVGLSCIYIPDMQAYGVQSVINGTPAQHAGLQAGDLILTVNGQPVFEPSLVNTELVRGRLDLQIIREGLPSPLQLTLFPSLVQNVSF